MSEILGKENRNIPNDSWFLFMFGYYYHSIELQLCFLHMENDFESTTPLSISFQANITRTNHVMWTMGTDFKYQYAHTWFRQMDKLIHYVNQVTYLQLFA